MRLWVLFDDLTRQCFARCFRVKNRNGYTYTITVDSHNFFLWFIECTNHPLYKTLSQSGRHCRFRKQLRFGASCRRGLKCLAEWGRWQLVSTSVPEIAVWLWETYPISNTYETRKISNCDHHCATRGRSSLLTAIRFPTPRGAERPDYGDPPGRFTVFVSLIDLIMFLSYLGP